MNYVVTGAQGFVGRYLVARIFAADRAAVVTGLGRSPRSDTTFTHSVRWGETRLPAPLTADLAAAAKNERYTYASLDLLNTKGLTTQIQIANPDIIFHMASGLRDDRLEDLVGSNILASISLAEAVAASKAPVRSIVFGSSGGVYGIPMDGLPIPESARCEPVDAYAASKLASEHLTRIVARRLTLPVVFARIFNIVGPGQDERHVCGRFAAQAAIIADNLAPRVVVAGNLDATRDFIDVRDIARALLMLTFAGSPGEAYNIGSGRETPIRSVLSSTLRAAGISERVEVRPAPPRDSDIPRHFADVGKLYALGYRPQWSLEQSIADTVAYYREDVARAAP